MAEEKSGELVLTDLVSEDQILEDRLLQTKQTGIAMGAFPKKITAEEIKRSQRLPQIVEMIARKKLTQETE